jgi:hypothetical protein
MLYRVFNPEHGLAHFAEQIPRVCPQGALLVADSWERATNVSSHLRPAWVRVGSRFAIPCNERHNIDDRLQDTQNHIAFYICSDHG